MSRSGSESGNGDGNGGGGGNGRIGDMRFITSIWQMEPDLSRCLYASPTSNVAATFQERPPATGYFFIRPAPFGRLIVPQMTRLGRTGVFATPSYGTGAFIPPIAPPSYGTGAFIPPIAPPSQYGTVTATPSQSGTGAGR